MRASLLALIVMCWSLQVLAVTIEQPLADAAREAQAQELFHALKCVVCEGQSLAESDATLAVQMRGHIRDMLREGESKQAVLDYFRSRYGDRIVMSPPLSGRTALLWAAPLLFLVIGGVAIWRLSKKQEDGSCG